MMPTICNEQTPVLPPSYHRREVQAQARIARALHINALSLIETFHLLALCRLAVQLAHRRCPPPLPKGTGGRLRAYREESLLLIALLKTLWRLSYQDVHDRLESWPALARPVACYSTPLASRAFPALPNCANAGKRQERLPLRPFSYSPSGVPCAAILAWRRTDPDAATGHAPAHHPRPLLRGYRVHTLLCRGSGLPVHFLVSPANCHDLVRQVALTYTSSIVVAMAAWHAHRPDLIRSPKRVLAHLWENS
jgi:hypothetical protein